MHAPTAESMCSWALAAVSVAPKPSGSSKLATWLRMYPLAFNPPCHSTLLRQGPLTAFATSGFVFRSWTNCSSLEASRPFRSFRSTSCMGIAKHDVRYISIAGARLGGYSDSLSQLLCSRAYRLKLGRGSCSIVDRAFSEGSESAVRVEIYLRRIEELRCVSDALLDK